MVSEITVDRSPESGGTKITLPDDVIFISISQ